MSVVEHRIVSTGGDFITNSLAFVEIPDTRLVFQVQDQATVVISADLGIWGNPAEVALLLDGAIIGMITVADTRYRFDSCTVAFRMTALVAAGIHELRLDLRAIEGHGLEEGATPEGPREWSPRKKKKREREVLAKVMRSPEVPISIVAIVV